MSRRGCTFPRHFCQSLIKNTCRVLLLLLVNKNVVTICQSVLPLTQHIICNNIFTLIFLYLFFFEPRNFFGSRIQIVLTEGRSCPLMVLVFQGNTFFTGQITACHTLVLKNLCKIELILNIVEVYGIEILSFLSRRLWGNHLILR